MLPFPQTQSLSHTHQAFNSHQCPLYSFSEVAAAFAPERQEVKNMRGKEKKEVTKFTVKNDFKCFQELIEDSWIWVSTTELLNYTVEV